MLEKTQRRLFRALFLLGCVLPTLAVAGYATNRLLPAYERAVLAGAAERFGVAVTCDGLATPRPGVYELRGVRLGEAAVCDRVRLQASGDGWRFEAGELTLLDPGAAASCLRALRSDGLTCRGRVESVTLGGAARLERVRIDSSEEILRLTSESGPNAELVADTLRVDTAGQSLPLTWLPATPIASDWADSMAFVGRLEVAGDAGLAVGAYDTRGLSIGGLVAEAGSLTEARLRWRGDRVAELSGRLTLQNGVLSKQLAHGFMWGLQMPPSEDLRRHWGQLSRVRFSDAAVGVSLDGEGLRLASEGSAVSDGVTPLLAPPAETLPVSCLVKAWHTGAPADLPSSPAAIEMARRLPASEPR